MKGHRGEAVDCGARNIFMRATVVEEEKNKRYKVKYNKEIYFPRGKKNLYIKKKKIYKLYNK